MKYLGIDYGTKKVGLALSDDEGTLAFPHSVVRNDGTLRELIEELLEGEEISAIVMGHSLGMDGEENSVMEGAHGLKGTLEREGYIVHLEPEFLTTAQAKRETPDTMADASAAALILQTFLDKKRNAT
ncbi:Holliday junction resolvase RuvX [bacterium]|nr:Holliday junction resolvase RuvX [bacterium]|tara:strand:- start:3300 stop:3683 length:384 start_codon:yes stop_codon:yes gene_type:complete